MPYSNRQDLYQIALNMFVTYIYIYICYCALLIERYPLFCTGILCTSPLVWEGVEINGSSREYGATIGVTCTGGRNFTTGVTQVKSTCTARGVWKPSMPECTGIYMVRLGTCF